MNEDLLENEDLLDEYEGSFSSEEKISHAMKLSKESFSIDVGVVDFDDLLIPEPMKTGRKETYLGLSTSIGELGIVSPIHVMITEGYANWKNSGGSEEEFDGFRYVLLHGFRRVWGGYKNGLERCMAVIWDFKDKDKGNDISMVLSNLLHKSQKHSWMEVWEMYQLLTAQASVSESSIEYLLQIDIGDAPKLKSIMERADEFPEPKQDLLDNKKTLQQAYNMLQKQMKEVDQLAKDDVTGISDMEQAEGVVEGSEDILLSDDEIKDILEMGSGGDELSDDDFGGMLDNEDGIYDRQTVGERHPLDPILKAKTMERDNFTCQCCGFGEQSGASRIVAMSVLQSHHKISVSNSGPDTEENITTICMVCHTLVHICIKKGLKLGMGREEFNLLSDKEKERYKKIMRLAKLDWEAGRRLGKNKDRIIKDNSNYSKFKMPGTDLEQNLNAVKTL